MNSSKPVVSLIAAIDENNALGYQNQLLCHLPADLKYFKKSTLNKAIIMGRKTFESIGYPLPQRLNIVVTSKSMIHQDVLIASSLDEAINYCKDYPEIMIIGGAKIFKEALSFANKLYLTIIHNKFEKADVYFPDLDETIWFKTEINHYKKDEKNQYDLTFYEYSRI